MATFRIRKVQKIGGFSWVESYSPGEWMFWQLLALPYKLAWFTIKWACIATWYILKWTSVGIYNLTTYLYKKYKERKGVGQQQFQPVQV